MYVSQPMYMYNEEAIIIVFVNVHVRVYFVRSFRESCPRGSQSVIAINKPKIRVLKA